MKLLSKCIALQKRIIPLSPFHLLVVRCKCHFNLLVRNFDVKKKGFEFKITAHMVYVEKMLLANSGMPFCQEQQRISSHRKEILRNIKFIKIFNIRTNPNWWLRTFCGSLSKIRINDVKHFFEWFSNKIKHVIRPKAIRYFFCTDVYNQISWTQTEA